MDRSTCMMHSRRAPHWSLWAAAAALVTVPAVAQAGNAAPHAASGQLRATPPVDRKPEPTPPPEAAPLTLAQLERRALDRNPTLNQADAAVDIARGRRRQAGLYPNPTLHYHGEEVGVAGTAGQQGTRLEQSIMTGGKLRKSRGVRDQELEQAKANRQRQEGAVLLNIRQLYFQALAAQQRIELRTHLVAVAGETLETTRELQNIGLAKETEVLQAQVEADRARLALNQATADRARVWVQIGAVTGDPDLAAAQPLAGSLEDLPPAIDAAAELKRLLDQSPELDFAEASVA